MPPFPASPAPLPSALSNPYKPRCGAAHATPHRRVGDSPRFAETLTFDNRAGGPDTGRPPGRHPRQARGPGVGYLSRVRGPRIIPVFAFRPPYPESADSGRVRDSRSSIHRESPIQGCRESSRQHGATISYDLERLTKRVPRLCEEPRWNRGDDAISEIASLRSQ